MHFSYSRIETIKHQEGVSTMKKKICSILAMNSTAYINSVNRQLTAVPKNYDSTYYAVRTFASGKVGVYESYISSLPVVGLEGKTVATAVLSNPFYPVYAQ